MIDFHRVWVEQVRAAHDIREDHGVERALGYLVGEKFLNHLRAARTRPEFAGETAAFAAGVREVFGQHELRAWFDSVGRVGALGHAATDEQFALLRAAGALDEDPVRGADEIVLLD